MLKKEIDSIAWLLRNAKEKGQPKPIVFLGAGASISAGIPGSKQIIADILHRFADKPEIFKLDDTQKKNYYSLMSSLNTDERHELLRGYITNEEVKINVTHIYLAQMLKEGYIDYVLTVNFDDLFLRACALFNFIPPVYDISILKDFTTTTLTEKSVTYLHGQHHGFWLLNTDEELKKVEEYIPTVLDRICNKRTWLVVGYSGEDPIFKQIARLGHFTNELFWIGYNEDKPHDNVLKQLIEKPNSNAWWVSGYDSDSFFLKLHSELQISTPEIFTKPFSFLKSFMGNIRDIKEPLSDSKHKKLFEDIKKRYEVAIKQTDAAIRVYEESDPSGALSAGDISRDQLKQEIIEATVKGKTEFAFELLRKIDNNDVELKKLLAQLFYNWADETSEAGDIESIGNSIDKYKMAYELDPGDWYILNDWGAALHNMANISPDIDKYNEAVDKYKLALSLNPGNVSILRNLGGILFKIVENFGFEELYDQATDYFTKAYDLSEHRLTTLEDWIASLIEMASKRNEKKYYFEAIEKCRLLLDIDSKNSEAYFNWASALFEIGEITNEIEFYEESSDKSSIAAELNPKNGAIFYNWAHTIIALAKRSNDEAKTNLLLLAKEKAEIAVQLGNGTYNLACVFALLNEKEKALLNLDNALKDEKISVDKVRKDSDWIEFKNDKEFNRLLNKYNKTLTLVEV